jgi:hypothetical protein
MFEYLRIHINQIHQIVMYLVRPVKLDIEPEDFTLAPNLKERRAYVGNPDN